MTDKILTPGFADWVEQLCATPIPAWQRELIDRIAALPPGARLVTVDRCRGHLMELTQAILDRAAERLMRDADLRPNRVTHIWIDEASDIKLEQIDDFFEAQKPAPR